MSQISHIKYKDVIEAWRFDADFFRPEYLELREKLSNIKCNKIKSFIPSSKVITWHTPSKQNDKFYWGNINFIKTDNLRENYINHNFNDFLSELWNEEIKSSQLKKWDIIVTIIWASEKVVWRVSIVREEDLPANINQNIALIRVNPDLINPDLLNIYLNSKYWRWYLHSISRQTEQVNLNCKEVENVLVPLFNNNIQQSISEIVQKAYNKKQLSKQLYHEAEDLLLREIWLKEHTISHTLTFSTTKKAVDEAWRYDADYFQPKYDELIEKIENYKWGWDYVENLFKYKKWFEPWAEAYTQEWIDFIRVSDFTKFWIDGVEKKISEKMYDELKENYQAKKWEILFTKDWTIWITYVLKEDLKWIISSAFLRLNLKEEYENYEKECLALILNSIICKLQVERFSWWALISHLKPSDFEKIKLPLINSELQKEISDKIKESFKLRNESKELLEQAKKMVEDEIEKE